MRSASLYHISGNSLVASALLWVISTLVLPHGSANTVADVMARVGSAWIISGLLAIVGSVLVIVAIIGIYRHFVGSDQEGMALLGATCGGTGALLMMACMAIASASIPIMNGMAQAGTLAAPEPGEAALILAMTGLAVVGGTLLWLSLIPFGFAMLRDAAWPRAIAWSAVGMGVLEAICGFLFMRNHLAQMLISILGFALLAVIGNALARIPRSWATPVEQAGAPV